MHETAIPLNVVRIPCDPSTENTMDLSIDDVSGDDGKWRYGVQQRVMKSIWSPRASVQTRPHHNARRSLALRERTSTGRIERQQQRRRGPGNHHDKGERNLLAQMWMKRESDIEFSVSLAFSHHVTPGWCSTRSFGVVHASVW